MQPRGALHIPLLDARHCPHCGTILVGKFCSNCGSPSPDGGRGQRPVGGLMLPEQPQQQLQQPQNPIRGENLATRTSEPIGLPPLSPPTSRRLVLESPSPPDSPLKKSPGELPTQAAEKPANSTRTTSQEERERILRKYGGDAASPRGAGIRVSSTGQSNENVVKEEQPRENPADPYGKTGRTMILVLGIAWLVFGVWCGVVAFGGAPLGERQYTDSRGDERLDVMLTTNELLWCTRDNSTSGGILLANNRYMDAWDCPGYDVSDVTCGDVWSNVEVTAGCLGVVFGLSLVGMLMTILLRTTTTRYYLYGLLSGIVAVLRIVLAVCALVFSVNTLSIECDSMKLQADAKTLEAANVGLSPLVFVPLVGECVVGAVFILGVFSVLCFG